LSIARRISFAILRAFFLVEGFFAFWLERSAPLGAPLWLERHCGDFRLRLACSFLGNLGLMIEALRPLGAPLALAGQAA